MRQSDRHRDSDLRFDVVGKLGKRQGGAAAMQPLSAAQIEECFIDRQRLNERRQIVHDGAHFAPDRRIFLHVGADHCRAGTKLQRLEHRHGRPHALYTGHVAGRRNDTSLAAPDKAKQALAKGQQQASKGKWSAACDYFKKALAVYPRYALAWLELGRAQVKQNSFADARHSFQEAVTQDSRLIAGYDGLARLALQQHQWEQLAEVTDHIVQFAPDSTPEYWFLNSAANFNLGKVEKAGTSIERGLRLDPKHQLPQMEYLYGLILAGKQDYKSASEHLTTYLQLAPRANDAENARKALSQFQQRANLASK